MVFGVGYFDGMSTALLDAVRRYSEAHADREGMASTPIQGLSTVRAVRPSGLVHAVARPLVCLVLQGTKQVVKGAEAFTFAAGDSLLITADVPTVSQVTQASLVAPYLSLVLELEPAVLVDLALEMKGIPAGPGRPICSERTDGGVADAALRLIRLLNGPDVDPVLQTLRLRELHYWLLAGRHGPAIRRVGWPEGRAQRIGRAVAVLRTEYKRPMPIERLAALAGMSPSSFHRNFLAVTSLSPLQFQKQLRLIEARRLMVAEGSSAGRAAFAVGYESVPQFTREYGRMFGSSPVRDAASTRKDASTAA